MRTLIIGATFFLLWCIGGRWYYVCQVKGLCGGGEVIETPDAQPIVEEGAVELDAEEKISFEEKAITAVLSDKQLSAIDDIVQKMKADDAMNLKILGGFTPEEKDVETEFYENLGIARAASVRAMITKEGIADDRISLDATEDVAALENPIRFEFTRDVIEAAQYTFDNMTFSGINFASGDAQVNNFPREFVLYADSLKQVMNASSDRVLVVTGHTDDQGAEEMNYKLGIRRGNTLEYYLRNRFGIKAPIEVRSRGEKAPIADNSTAEGRRKNRRVQITIE